VGSFSGQVRASFRTEEFVRFLEELQPAYPQVSGTAHFRTLEGWLELTVQIERLRTTRVSGVARTDLSPRAELTFWFNTDQSFVGQTCRELEAVVSRFPVMAARPT
jgi:hypothetical protein